MAIEASTLLNLIDDSRDQLTRVEREIAVLAERLESAIADRDALNEELEAFQRSYDRRFPSASEPAEPIPGLDLVPGPTPSSGSDDGADADDGAATDPSDWSWTTMPRTYAVERAVEELAKRDGEATPEQIQAFLVARGRTDNRQDIGGALSHLRRTFKVNRLGRGRWMPIDYDVPLQIQADEYAARMEG